MNCLVTGCYGFIGKKMSEHLISHNHRVFGMDIEDKHLIISDGFEFVGYDSEAGEKRLKNKKIDVVYHFAWCGVSSSEKNNPNKQFLNIPLTYKILELAKRIGAKKIVIPGSVSEFSRCKKPISGFEKDSPSDLYAATKVSIRKIATQFCKTSEIDLNWAFITSVYGGERLDDNLLTYAIKKLLSGQEVMTTKLEQLWDYIFIDDLVVCLELIGLKGKKNTMYPVGSGRVEPLSYYVSFIANYLGKKDLLRIGALPYKNKYIDNSIVDISKIKKIGFKCKNTFEKNIVDVISFYENKKNNG